VLELTAEQWLFVGVVSRAVDHVITQPPARDAATTTRELSHVTVFHRISGRVCAHRRAVHNLQRSLALAINLPASS